MIHHHLAYSSPHSRIQYVWLGRSKYQKGQSTQLQSASHTDDTLALRSRLLAVLFFDTSWGSLTKNVHVGGILVLVRPEHLTQMMLLTTKNIPSLSFLTGSVTNHDVCHQAGETSNITEQKLISLHFTPLSPRYRKETFSIHLSPGVYRASHTDDAPIHSFRGLPLTGVGTSYAQLGKGHRQDGCDVQQNFSKRKVLSSIPYRTITHTSTSPLRRCTGVPHAVVQLPVSPQPLRNFTARPRLSLTSGKLASTCLHAHAHAYLTLRAGSSLLPRQLLLRLTPVCAYVLTRPPSFGH